jgi:hypothetical protein
MKWFTFNTKGIETSGGFWIARKFLDRSKPRSSMQSARNIAEAARQGSNGVSGRALPIRTATITGLDWDFGPNGAQHRVTIAAQFSPTFTFRRPFCSTTPNFRADHACATYNHSLLYRRAPVNPGKFTIGASYKARHDAGIFDTYGLRIGAEIRFMLSQRIASHIT